MVRSVTRDLPEQGKNNPAVNQAAGNGGQKMGQYSWFTVYGVVSSQGAVGLPTEAVGSKVFSHFSFSLFLNLQIE